MKYWVVYAFLVSVGKRPPDWRSGCCQGMAFLDVQPGKLYARIFGWRFFWRLVRRRRPVRLVLRADCSRPILVARWHGWLARSVVWLFCARAEVLAIRLAPGLWVVLYHPRLVGSSLTDALMSAGFRVERRELRGRHALHVLFCPAKILLLRNRRFEWLPVGRDKHT